MKNKNSDSFVFDAIVPMPLAKMLIGMFDDDEVDSETIYTDGGSPKRVFEKLGFKCWELSSEDDSQELSKILKCKNFSTKYVGTAHSSTKNKIYAKDFEVVPWHSYCLEVNDENCENGQREYIIRDPHNTLYETSLTYDELMECFDDFTFGLIE